MELCLMKEHNKSFTKTQWIMLSIKMSLLTAKEEKNNLTLSEVMEMAKMMLSLKLQRLFKSSIMLIWISHRVSLLEQEVVKK